MSNKKKNILVWIFTWAILLLVVLYSPLGSPDLYSSADGFYTAVPNADLSGSNLGSGSSNFSTTPDYNELNVPDYNSAEGTKLSSGNYNYTPNSGSSSGSTSHTSYAVSQTDPIQSVKTNNSSTGLNEGGSTFISNNSSKSSDASSAVTMSSGGVTTLSSDLTTPPTTKQAVNYGANQGGTDPGGDPTGPPLPITDGWIFMLLLAATYGVAKKWKIFTNKLR